MELAAWEATEGFQGQAGLAQQSFWALPETLQVLGAQEAGLVVHWGWAPKLSLWPFARVQRDNVKLPLSGCLRLQGGWQVTHPGLFLVPANSAACSGSPALPWRARRGAACTGSAGDLGDQHRMTLCAPVR